jgi:tetratricopeptide (TPR) repeat protein
VAVEFPKSVMLVSDDNLRNQAIIRKTVKDMQYDDVKAVSKTTEVLALILDGVGDIVIIDMENKSLDGVEAVRKIKEARLKERTPVFVSSGVATVQRIMELRAAGADGYILKPLTPNAILKQISSSANHREREIMSKFEKEAQEIASRQADLATELSAHLALIGRTISLLLRETRAFYWFERNFINIGRLLQQSGAGAKSVPFLEQAIALDTGAHLVEAHDLMAEHYEAIGDYSRAILHVRLAIQKQKKAEHGHLVKFGELQLKSGDISAAIETFNKAVSFIEGEIGAANSPELSESLNHRGKAYYDKGVRDDDKNSLNHAAQDLQRSTQMAANVLSAQYNLMMTYKKLGDEKKALETLNKIQSIEPDTCDGWLTIAETYHQGGESDKAAFALGKARKAAGADMDALKHIVDKQIAYSLFSKAEQLLVELQRAVPQESYAFNMMGILFRRQGKVELSIEQYKKAIELDPKNAAIFFNLGRALHDLGKKDEAVKTFQQCLELNPGMTDAKKYLESIVPA